MLWIDKGNDLYWQTSGIEDGLLLWEMYVSYLFLEYYYWFQNEASTSHWHHHHPLAWWKIQIGWAWRTKGNEPCLTKRQMIKWNVLSIALLLVDVYSRMKMAAGHSMVMFCRFDETHGHFQKGTSKSDNSIHTLLFSAHSNDCLSVILMCNL